MGGGVRRTRLEAAWEAGVRERSKWDRTRGAGFGGTRGGRQWIRSLGLPPTLANWLYSTYSTLSLLD